MLCGNDIETVARKSQWAMSCVRTNLGILQSLILAQKRRRVNVCQYAYRTGESVLISYAATLITSTRDEAY